LEHWQRIALNSSKQSKRTDIPKIESQIKFEEILVQKKEYDVGIICTLYPGTRKIREVLEEKMPKEILILIGPEGDFTPQEIESAKNEGFIPVSLGDLVLRTETAAIAICSFLKLYAYS
jgi:16S rRNA (uracil1498-N3)-methyltransferase